MVTYMEWQKQKNSKYFGLLFIYTFHLYDSSTYVVFMYCNLYLYCMCCISCIASVKDCMFTLHINIISACLVLYLHYIIVFVLHLYSFVACNSLWSVCCVFCVGRLGEWSDIKVLLFLSIASPWQQWLIFTTFPLLHHGNNGLFLKYLYDLSRAIEYVSHPAIWQKSLERHNTPPRKRGSDLIKCSIRQGIFLPEDLPLSWSSGYILCECRPRPRFASCLTHTLI